MMLPAPQLQSAVPSPSWRKRVTSTIALFVLVFFVLANSGVLRLVALVWRSVGTVSPTDLTLVMAFLAWAGAAGIVGILFWMLWKQRALWWMPVALGLLAAPVCWLLADQKPGADLAVFFPGPWLIYAFSDLIGRHVSPERFAVIVALQPVVYGLALAYALRIRQVQACIVGIFAFHALAFVAFLFALQAL